MIDRARQLDSGKVHATGRFPGDYTRTRCGGHCVGAPLASGGYTLAGWEGLSDDEPVTCGTCKRMGFK